MNLGLAGYLWPQVSHKAVMNLSARATIISRFDWWEDALPNSPVAITALSYSLAVGQKCQFLPCGPLHWIIHMTSLTVNKQESKGGYPRQAMVFLSLRLRSDTLLYCLILFIRSKWLLSKSLLTLIIQEIGGDHLRSRHHSEDVQESHILVVGVQICTNLASST